MLFKRLREATERQHTLTNAKNGAQQRQYFIFTVTLFVQCGGLKKVSLYK
jgi:hypothetical protein